MATYGFDDFTPHAVSIHDLPIEILQAIFVECPVRDLGSIILINKRWSLSCVSCPQLWTRLHIDMAVSRTTTRLTESFIRACYLRSSGLLLDVSLELGGFISPAHIQAGTLPAWALSILRTLLANDGSNAAKWNSLQVVWPHAVYNCHPVLRYFEVPMPNLKSLDLSLQSFDQYYMPRFPYLPLLEEYAFRDTNFGAKLPFDDSVLDTIRTLTCETNSWVTGDGETISKFKNITVLRLCNFAAISYIDPTFPSQIELPHVQTLHLWGFIPIFECLLLPSLRRVILEFNPTNGSDSRYRMVGQLTRWKVPEVELRLHGNADFDHRISQWVQDLRLRCWDLKELVMDDSLYDLFAMEDLKRDLDDTPREAKARTIIMRDVSLRRWHEYRAHDEEWLVGQMIR